jgi:CBS domain-containing protein
MRILDIIEAKRYAQRTQLLRPHDTIEFAANLLVTNDVGAAVVCDDVDGVVGILSERDILKGLVLYGPAVMTRRSRELMQPFVMYCSPEDTLAYAAMAMRKDGVRHLAVLEGSCALGVVGLRDLLAHMSVDEQQSH